MSTQTSNNDTTTLPHHTTSTPTTSSSNYASAVSAKSDREKLDGVTPVQVNDGRKNSGGEELPSPVATWKPNLARQQSWNQEDLKRSLTMSQMEKERDAGKGFSEVGRE